MPVEVEFAGLEAPGREAEVGGDGARAPEACRVINAGLERQCGDEADTGRRHQPLEDGIIVEFNLDCAQQKSQAPVMLGRVKFSLQPGINEVELAPAAHRRYGVSVELCSDERAWPKPYADPVGVTVKRKIGFWDRVKGWFQ